MGFQIVKNDPGGSQTIERPKARWIDGMHAGGSVNPLSQKLEDSWTQ